MPLSDPSRILTSDRFLPLSSRQTASRKQQISKSSHRITGQLGSAMVRSFGAHWRLEVIERRQGSSLRSKSGGSVVKVHRCPATVSSSGCKSEYPPQAHITHPLRGKERCDNPCGSARSGSAFLLAQSNREFFYRHLATILEILEEPIWLAPHIVADSVCSLFVFLAGRSIETSTDSQFLHFKMNQPR